MNEIELNPKFEGLDQPSTFKDHIQDLTMLDIVPHTQVLNQLLNQFEPLDFQAIAFPETVKIKEQLSKLSKEQSSDPENEDVKKRILSKLKEMGKYKVTTKHYLVLAIDNVLKVAEKNRWSLCKNHDFVYLFNGSFWDELDKETLQKFLGEAAEKMGVEKYSAKHFQFRDSLMKQFLATAYLPTPESDPEKVLINLSNGTFEISPKGTQLRPFDRADFLTYRLPFAYDPQKKASLFEAYLNKVLPDIDRQKVLAEYLGFVFIKHGSKRLKEEKALILYGTGANGKSVFFEVVSALLGTENTGNFSLQSLTNDNGYFRAKLANKLVNYASEINGKLESSIFKQLVSGEPVEARLPYGQPFILKQYAKLIFNCNELPKDVEHTNAYFRRFLIVPFDVTIPPHEQDKQLHTKIIENELSGVFNWVLDGLNRLLDQKRFSECKAAVQAVESYKSQSDSVKMFIDESNYQKSPDQFRLIKELYSEYRIYCNDDGFKPVNKSNFIKRVSGFGVLVDRLNVGNVAYLSNGNNTF